jgi:geranylgeranyl reductase family protein
VIDRPRPLHANLSARRWDAIIVGAGPAGSTAARQLALRGHAVLLLDRSPFPREKVCGDGLIPDALNALRRAGLLEQVRAAGYRADTLSAFSPSNIRVDLQGEFVTLRRRRLDFLLLQAAVAAGAEFHVARVQHITEQDGTVTVTVGDSDTPLRCQAGIVATGADVTLLDGLAHAPRRSTSAVALRRYVRSPITLRELVIVFHRSILPGYAWIFPLGGGEYNVGCGMFYRGTGKRPNLRATFQAFTTNFPLARKLMAAAEDATPLQGARLRTGLDRHVALPGQRILAIGETVGATFPFTGEGIGKAMETGEVAAEHVHRALDGHDMESLTHFPGVLRARLASKYVGYRVAENWIARPWVSDFVAHRVRSDPSLRRAAAGVLDETVDPRALFSWRLLLPRWVPGRTHLLRPAR